MAKTVDVSGWPMLAFKYALVGSVVFGVLFFVVLGVWTGISALGVTVPARGGAVWPAAFAVAYAVLTVAWIRRLRAADGNGWVSAPHDQEAGYLAGNLGLARSSWARAIRRYSAEVDPAEAEGEEGDGDVAANEATDGKADA